MSGSIQRKTQSLLAEAPPPATIASEGLDLPLCDL